MNNNQIIEWLLEGDVSIQYQIYRDLLSTEHKDLRKRIEAEGYGAQFLSKRKADGNWISSFISLNGRLRIIHSLICEI